MRIVRVSFVVAVALVILGGCAEQRVEEPVSPPDAQIAQGESEEAAQQVDLTAYINVSSGCQDPTVELLNELDAQYDSVAVEVVDFGTPEGMERMEEDDVGCMALLFDGSPVVRLPGDEGAEGRLITFYFPPGFGWSHEDLKDVFAAIDTGEAEILSEEEAKEALEPTQVALQVEVNQVDDAAQVLMNGEVAFTITEQAGGKTPMERAEAVRDGLVEWASEPVHPHQLSLQDADEGWVIFGRDIELAHVYPADAEAAGVEPGRKLASQWFTSIRRAIIAAADQGTEDPSD